MSHSALPTLGRYQIVRVLGRGAMGLVYEARDPNLERRVAIKTIRVDGLSADAAEEYAARFRTEARSAARLQHPNIVSVYDADRDGEAAYLVMEYVQGEDLKHHLDAGTRFTLEQTLRIAADLLAALDYAHRQNIVHRDVKPANLLLEASGRVKLADFGVARIQDAGEATRTRGSMVGTLKYMSPEQVQGQPVDARADLFAAGVVLYQLCTGRRPFEGDTDFAVIHQIVAQPLVPASSINPQLPAALDAVLDRAMSKAREDRFATAHDFAEALQAACGSLTDRTILAPPHQGSAHGTGSGAGSGTGIGTRGRALRSTGSTVPFGPRTGEDTGATVTQELELVYWKDVRDSPDAADLEGFLLRFPEGIYADLARRRLRKLQGQDTFTRGDATRDEPTRLDVAADIGADTAADTGGDAAREAAAPQGAPPPSTVPPAAEQVQDEASAPVRAPASAPAPDGGSAEAAPTPAPTPAPTSAPPPARRRGPVLAALAGVAAVAVGAALLYPAQPSGDVPPATAGAAGPVAAMPAAPSSLPASADAALPDAAKPPASVADVAAVAAVVPVAASASAATPAVPVSAARPAQRTPARQGPASGAQASAPQGDAPSPRVASPPQTGTAPPAAAAATATARPAPAAAAPAAASDPTKACEGRVLLGYQICLNGQCAQPAFAQHPVCVERRMAEQARRERSESGRN